MKSKTKKRGLGNSRRRVVKAITYGALHFCVAFSVTLILTGNVALALGIGLVEPAVQTVAYVLHEWAWDGRRQAAMA